MKKTLLLLLFCCFTLPGISQEKLNAPQKDLIVGNWIFKKVLNKDVDEQALEYLKAEIIDKWKYVFKSDGGFETYIMGEKETGKWKLSSDSKSIILFGIDEETIEFVILRSTADELSLKLGLGEFLLKRIEG